MQKDILSIVWNQKILDTAEVRTLNEIMRKYNCYGVGSVATFAFLYGKILGKRAERQRRGKHHECMD